MNDTNSKRMKDPLLRNLVGTENGSGRESRRLPRNPKLINYGAGVLIQKWCRHQYTKGLFPTLLAVWYWGLSYIGVDYQRKASNYILNQVNLYNCTTIVSEEVSLVSCGHLNVENQYYFHDDNGKYYKRTVSCTLEGASFFYPRDFFDVYNDNYYLQLFINFILPLVFTYLVYETLYLALYDCLVIIPGLKTDPETNKVFPVLQYAAKPYRVSWFVVRKWYKRCTSARNNDDLLSTPPEKLPGIRVGRYTSFAINTFTILIFISIISFIGDDLFTGSQKYQCMEQSGEAFHSLRKVIITLLFLYLFLAGIPTYFYYYKLFFQLKDIELLAYQYSREFYTRRISGIRNLLDLIPLLLFPVSINLLYYPFIWFPHFLVYSCFYKRACCWRCFGCCGLECCLPETMENCKAACYENYWEMILWPKWQWWRNWFLQPIDEDELRANEELERDDNVDDDHDFDDGRN
jgi:hypothetical protein